jgi:hypothetical protein
VPKTDPRPSGKKRKIFRRFEWPGSAKQVYRMGTGRETSRVQGDPEVLRCWFERFPAIE